METNKRIAIVNPDKCKPNKCGQECQKNCPINRSGKLCIEATKASKQALIAENLCIGCGICVKKCPFNAIRIINLPTQLNKLITHRYGQNGFILHRLPMPRAGQVLGLMGSNGTGKSTALKILGGKLTPNLGKYENPPTWTEIIKNFRGSSLQNYFKKMVEEDVQTVIKPQSLEELKKIEIKVGDFAKKNDQRGVLSELVKTLDLEHLLERNIDQLSGGELQRFAILVTACLKKDVYMFDEPSSYLDIKQRLRAAEVIRSILTPENYVIAVEHDLSVLDYLSDFVCCLYGDPGAFGVVTLPSGVRDGINIFLEGYIPTENVRFRDEELNFRFSERVEAEVSDVQEYKYPNMEKMKGDFKLNVEAGAFSKSQIIVMLGENGTGKTTFIQMLAEKDWGDEKEGPQLKVSYKPQTINPKFEGTVEELLQSKLQGMETDEHFMSQVIRPMDIQHLYNSKVKTLSGGELQRVALILALGKPADLYLLDEPSAYLDSEQRLASSKVIKRFILNSKKAGFVVEHDFIMATYLADLVIVYEGTPGKECVARKPEKLLSGMNKFLSMLGITFKRDPTNFRPRINKLGSRRDREQKQAGNYFTLDY